MCVDGKYGVVAAVEHQNGNVQVRCKLKGIGLGFVTPFCTYSAVPMLLGLQRAVVLEPENESYAEALAALKPAG